MKRRVSPAAAVTVAVLAFLYLPIGMVIVNAFNADESLVGWVARHSSGSPSVRRRAGA
ncbi:hypothetical protein GS943_01995 [Rhodococcus hoagii]|nr:hypothetical protein [Prescottella equi]